MRKERDYKSINIKIAITYFSILVGTQAIAIIFLLKRPSILTALLVGLGMGAVLPVALGVAIILVVKMKYGTGIARRLRKASVKEVNKLYITT